MNKEQEQTIFYFHELAGESRERALTEVFNKYHEMAFEQLAIDLVQNLYMVMFELAVQDIKYTETYSHSLVDCFVEIDADRWEIMDVRVLDALQAMYDALYDEDILISIIDKHSIMFTEDGNTF